MDFTNKAVLITGASRGIGRAAAMAFLEGGARVAVNGRAAASVAAAMDALGGGDRLAAAPGDVGTVAGCEAAVAAAVDALGGLDVLVNSAGVGYGRPIEESDEAIWDETLDVNLNSPLKKASLTGFHATAKHIAAKAVSPSSETMRTI